MNILEVIRLYLLSIPGITNITGDRIYPVYLPQAKQSQITDGLGALVVSDVSGVNNLEGPAGDDGTTRGRFQFDCWGTNNRDAYDLARALRLALHGFRGQFPGGYNVMVASQENTLLSNARDVELSRVVSDYIILYQDLTLKLMEV